MKQFNEQIYNFTLVSTVRFHIFINKDMPKYFAKGKIQLITIYKETDKLLNRYISLPIAIDTVPVHHMCSVANQA